ncbi:hypothetical protein UT300007_34940 [Clostridium sp. CTA-7]
MNIVRAQDFPQTIFINAHALKKSTARQTRLGDFFMFIIQYIPTFKNIFYQYKYKLF